MAPTPNEAEFGSNCNPSSQEHEAPSQHFEPIAIVGVSLKFPGDATSVNNFWSMLEAGRSTVTEFPAERMQPNSIYHPDPTRHDTTAVKAANFLSEDVAAFDAPFFAISAAEAASMDPQQRLLLEVVYHALENERLINGEAGIPMEHVATSRTSVFNGCFTDDFKGLYTKDVESAASYAATGITTTLNANRISWFFNLKGESLNIDTACSSSLVALDLACQSLHCGNSNMASLSKQEIK
ncbi:MAG: hypothetical protein Q9159_004694 [Coniocarpon cinnabarinum]